MTWYACVVVFVCAADSTRLFASADLNPSGYVIRTTLVVELLKKVQDLSYNFLVCTTPYKSS